MSKKHTAEDFANARFATNDSGSAAHRRYDGWVLGSEVRHTDEQMASAGWVPVQAPGRTITQSEYNDVVYSRVIGFRQGYDAAMLAFGGRVVPDPVPTNVELLAKLIRESGIPVGNFDDDYKELAKSLDEDGVKVPEET